MTLAIKLDEPEKDEDEDMDWDVDEDELRVELRRPTKHDSAERKRRGITNRLKIIRSFEHDSLTTGAIRA